MAKINMQFTKLGACKMLCSRFSVNTVWARKLSGHSTVICCYWPRRYVPRVNDVDCLTPGV